MTTAGPYTEGETEPSAAQIYLNAALHLRESLITSYGCSRDVWKANEEMAGRLKKAGGYGSFPRMKEMPDKEAQDLVVKLFERLMKEADSSFEITEE